MKPQAWFLCGALLAALGVMNGAYAAHGLADTLFERYETLDLDVDIQRLIPRRLDQYETGVRYQLLHSVGLMLLGIVAVRRPSPIWALAGFGFLAGIMIFSVMLYILVLTNVERLGMFVPIGGLSFIVGWLALGTGGYVALGSPPAAAPPTPRGAAEHADDDFTKTVELNVSEPAPPTGSPS